MQENFAKHYIQRKLVSWDWFCAYYLIESGEKEIYLDAKIFGFCNTGWFYGYDTQIVSLKLIWKKFFEVYPECLSA